MPEVEIVYLDILSIHPQVVVERYTRLGLMVYLDSDPEKTLVQVY